MTREAGHPTGSSSELGVGVAHELNHLSRSLLLGLVIFLELVFDMAVGAIDSERRFEREHDLGQSFRGNPSEQLNILVLLFCAFFLAAGRQWIERRKLRGFSCLGGW